MILGSAYDNNLLCIAEKEVFVVDAVADALLAAMDRAGAVRLDSRDFRRSQQQPPQPGRIQAMIGQSRYHTAQFT